MIRITAAVSAAFLAALVAAPAPRAADLPQATRDMLKELKIDEKLLAGSEKEYEVPAAWLEGAKKEGALKIIGTWDPGQHRKYMKPFEERYPGVKFDYTRAGRNDRTVKPLLAFKEGRYLGDVISGLGNAYFIYRESKALMKLADLPNARLLGEDLLDPAGFWVGHQASYWCVSYNKKLVKQEDLPRTWDGFLDASKWGNGRIGMGNRANLWFVQLWKAHGADWARSFMDKLFNEVKPQQRKEGMNALVGLVIAGEFAVTIPSAMYRVSQLADKGAPVGYHCPEPVPSTVQSIVALNGNPHPNGTRIYVNWMISKEGQIAQYYALQASSVREELQIPELVAFPEAIKGKKKTFRDPELLHATWPQVLTAWSAHWDAASGVKTVTAQLDKVIREGRQLQFKAGSAMHTVRISQSRTAMRIHGKKAGRGDFKEGMQCTFVYPDDKGEAREVICK
jgi:iron(III) transport system substrate-binding protein